MNKPLVHKFFLRCKEQVLLWVKDIKEYSRKVVTGLSRSPAQRMRMMLAAFFLFLAVFAWTYLVKTGKEEESAPLLIGEVVRETNRSEQDTVEKDTVTLAELEQEIIDLRSKMEELTESHRPQSQNKAEIRPTDFGRPVPGQVIRGPGWVRNGKEWRYHSGVDLTLPPGQPVLACADGRIVEIKTHPTLGTMLRIEHGAGWESIYGRLAEVCVSREQTVKKGAVLGKTFPSTCGPEPGIHFDLLYDGEEIDPRSVIPGL